MSELVKGYDIGKAHPKKKIKEVFSDDECTKYQNEGWDLIAVVSSERHYTTMTMPTYIMAKVVE